MLRFKEPFERRSKGGWPVISGTEKFSHNLPQEKILVFIRGSSKRELSQKRGLATTFFNVQKCTLTTKRWLEPSGGLNNDMEYFLQQLINGVTLGSIYGLIAIGYTMVYGIIGMINFAHGDIFMVGAFISLILIVALGVTASMPLALLILALIAILIVSMALTSVWGWTVERIAYRPLRGSFRLAPLITAIGASIVLQNFVQISQGARNKPLQPLIPGGFTLSDGSGDSGFVVQLSYSQILIIVVTTVLMIGFTTLINKTSLGRAQRSCEQDRKMASLLGINVDRTISLTFVMGASLASVAGLMFLIYYGVIDFYIGFLAGVKAFTAAVLGGIGSLPGAMLGGLLIGLIETFWSGYFSVEYKDVAAFSILAIVLIFMPEGLLGKPEVEKV
ncbi:amino acid/amide ABC transporter membrane protein 1, HAAT family [Roseibium suaedae]|uniref:Amino acid/amide ABC transporter membrane protein 1, HAAT family n=2 Tax=Roseibium suaedae TaxID=735517 RepID=A0A1M7G7I8_9HYPH|nr:amino acid/amide ABC transporter membrane protein 1, HAAT family [Roseibium suaedae]